MTPSSHPLPTVFLPHGAGPCFFMDWQPSGLWEPMAAWLGGLTESLKVQPRAILVISAHWQADSFTVNAQSAPSLYYDYYGFPEHTYRLSWPAQGDPDSRAFDDWLSEAVALLGEARASRLRDWATAPVDKNPTPKRNTCCRCSWRPVPAERRQGKRLSRTR